MRSNTPVTLTHHTTPPPYYCHTHSVHTSIPNAQVSRARLLVWYGGAAAIRGGQAGGGSHSTGCAVPPYQHTRPTYQHSHLVLLVLPPNQGSQSLPRSRKITKQFKKSNQNTNGGAPRFKHALSVPTQNRNTSRQDFQFSLLPATSVARGKKSSQPLINHE